MWHASEQLPALCCKLGRRAACLAVSFPGAEKACLPGRGPRAGATPGDRWVERASRDACCVPPDASK